MLFFLLSPNLVFAQPNPTNTFHGDRYILGDLYLNYIFGNISNATIDDQNNNFLYKDLEWILDYLNQRSTDIEASVLGSNLIGIKHTLLANTQDLSYTYVSLGSSYTIESVIDAHCGFRIPPNQWILSNFNGPSYHLNKLDYHSDFVWFEAGTELNILFTVKLIPTQEYYPYYIEYGRGIWHHLNDYPPQSMIIDSRSLLL